MKQLFILIFLLFVLFLWSCQPAGSGASAEERPATDPQSVVDHAIARHGGELYQQIAIEFDFRKYHYQLMRRNGAFLYERSFQDSLGHTYHDVLNNQEFYRERDGERQSLTAKDSSAYANSVNSVAYFALLPYFLNDPAVQKEYLGEATIGGAPYHKVGVTFRQEGGGKDFQDEFVYWFHRDDHTLDYLAYNYETSGGGARFREAYNPREVGGLRFQDYRNFKPVNGSMAVATFDRLFKADSLELVSDIKLENVQVEKPAGE